MEINVTRKKIIVPEPEPIYRDVCIKIDPKLRIESHGDWVLEVGNAAWAWPSLVKEFVVHMDEGDIAEYKRLHAFLEKGTDQEAIIYHRCGKHLSWIVLDEYIYANLCRSLHIDRDFVLLERDSRMFELVHRKTTASSPPLLTQTQLDEQLANTIVSDLK
jgi:hypothetical protein